MTPGAFAPHPWQQAAIESYFDRGGLFCGLGPGAGKTYTAAMIAKRCAKPLVMAPAAVIPQTQRMFSEYGAPNVTFASYTWLQQAKQAEFFQRFRPTDILLDEAHRARRVATNSASKRMWQYLMTNPAVRVGWFTGSPSSGSGEDFAYGLRAALRGGAPVPATLHGIRDWSARLESDPEYRAEFLARLQATPGVFLDAGLPSYDGRVAITVRHQEPALRLGADWVLPDGWFLGSPAEAAHVAKAMAWGYWPRVTPRPAEEYLEARRIWGAVVRGIRERDASWTESQIRELRPREYQAWRAVADRHEPLPEPEAVWVDDAGLRAALRAADQPGTIIWAHSRAVQRRAAEILGVPHHGALGRDASGLRLDETTQPVVVASLTACSEGYNAQQFYRNVFLEPPSDPEVLRQAIGRTARQGQRQSTVHVDLVLCGEEYRNSLRAAIARAKLVQETTGNTNPILQLEGTEI